ncbi:LapA family protein [Geminocystis herdmanii]|uniref:LapA family protein n=1 Tax=Geminocystis herdmanii TaxID=669359 RepID=UPI00034B7CFC|nr:LapA family protein [Geminocystis herdmanii]
MGFKIILLISIVLIIALFTVQNAQNITLVFLGFNSLNLPLSLWMILAVLAGIVSSFMIQLLSSSSSNKNSNYSNYSPSESDNNPPPRKPKSSFKQQPDNQVYSPPLPVENNLKYNNPNEELDADFDFDFEEDLTPKKPLTDNQENNNNFQQSQDSFDSDFDFEEDFSSENPPFEENLPLENVPEVKSIINEINQEVAPEINPIIPEESPQIEIKKVINPNDNIPSETFLKPREASLYSYKPGEKTEISSKPTNIKTSQKNDPKSSIAQRHFVIEPSKPSENRYSGGVYDAPYRVISPGYDDTSPLENDEFFEDDEDWDF